MRNFREWLERWSWTWRSPRTSCSPARGCPWRAPTTQGRSSSWRGRRKLRGRRRCEWSLAECELLLGRVEGTRGATPDLRSCPARESSFSLKAFSSCRRGVQERREPNGSLAASPDWMRSKTAPTASLIENLRESSARKQVKMDKATKQRCGREDRTNLWGIKRRD